MIDAQELIRRARNAGVDSETIVAMLMDGAAKDADRKTEHATKRNVDLVTLAGADDAVKESDGRMPDGSPLPHEHMPDGIPLPPRNTVEMIWEHGRERFCGLSVAMERLGWMDRPGLIAGIRNVLGEAKARERRDIRLIDRLCRENGAQREIVEGVGGCMLSSTAICSRSLDVTDSMLSSLARAGRVRRDTVKIAERNTTFNRTFYDVADLVKLVPETMGERWVGYFETLDACWKDCGKQLEQENAQ